MSNFPKVLLTVLNAGILIYGLYYVLAYQSVSVNSSINQCVRVSHNSIQLFGAFCLVVAAVGIAGTWLEMRALQYIYIAALVCSTAAAILYCIFMWVVMPSRPAFQVFKDMSENGTWLPEYNILAQRIIGNDRDFGAAQKCFNTTNMCRTMLEQTEDQKVVFFDVGCCNPPNRCGLLQARNGTWVVGEWGLNSTDKECQMWAKTRLNCFWCDSCRAAYVANYQSHWDVNRSGWLEFILVLLILLALGYYIFFDEHFRGWYMDRKHGKLGISNI